MLLRIQKYLSYKKKKNGFVILFSGQWSVVSKSRISPAPKEFLPQRSTGLLPKGMPLALEDAFPSESPRESRGPLDWYKQLSESEFTEFKNEQDFFTPDFDNSLIPDSLITDYGSLNNHLPFRHLAIAFQHKHIHPASIPRNVNA